MKTRYWAFACILTIALWAAAPILADGAGQPEIVSATVSYVGATTETEFLGQAVLVQELELSLTSGARRGDVVSLSHTVQTYAGMEPLETGDLVYLRVTETETGTLYELATRSRWIPLALLTLLFAALVITIGKARGAASLLGLGFSFLVIFVIVLPRLESDHDPFWTVLGASALTLPCSYILTHGPNLKTGIALIGSLLGLFVTGLLSLAAVGLTQLTGYAAEETGFLQVSGSGVWDVRGLLLAGIMVSLLGVLDDITVAQAGIVQQIQQANASFAWRELYVRAMQVGQDHIASMVNTLMLVYAGSSLALLLLLRDATLPLGYLLSQEIIAEEIVRMLISSCGLILAVPATTALASIAFAGRSAPEVTDSGQESGSDDAPDR